MCACGLRQTFDEIRIARRGVGQGFSTDTPVRAKIAPRPKAMYFVNASERIGWLLTSA